MGRNQRDSPFVTERFLVDDDGTDLFLKGVIGSSISTFLKYHLSTGILRLYSVTVGDAGTTSHALTADDDLFVTGRLEVDGVTYFDGVVTFSSYITLLDSQPVYFGSSTDSMLLWNALQTPDTLMLALGADSNGLVITKKVNTGFDFAHPLQTNPTLFVHSAAQSTTQWIGFTHDGTNALISTGAGLITFANETAVSPDTMFRKSCASGITASTTQTQGNGELSNQINEIATCANANDTVTLMPATAGYSCTIINNGANTLRIYPGGSDNLGAGVDTATTLAAGSNITFAAYDGTNWETI